MALLKKVLLGVAGVVSLGLVGNSFAEAGKNIDTAVTVTDVNTAAQALVKEIIADPSNNHVFPPKSSYNGLTLAPLVQTDYAGTFDTDDKNHLSGINITSIKIQAAGVPLVNNYPAKVSFKVTVLPDCKTLSNPAYTLVQGIGGGSIIDTLFQKDLTSYAHVVFDSLLASSGLNAFCQK